MTALDVLLIAREGQEPIGSFPALVDLKPCLVTAVLVRTAVIEMSGTAPRLVRLAVVEVPNPEAIHWSPDRGRRGSENGEPDKHGPLRGTAAQQVAKSRKVNRRFVGAFTAPLNPDERRVARDKSDRRALEDQAWRAKVIKASIKRIRKPRPRKPVEALLRFSWIAQRELKAKGQQRCPQCEQIKLIPEFYGKTGYCKPCRLEYQRKDRVKRKAEGRVIPHGPNPINPCPICGAAKQRAAKSCRACWRKSHEEAA